MVFQCYTWILHLFQRVFGDHDDAVDSIEDIPDAIILNILRRLPAKSIFQCQRVCKKWLALISYEFIEMQERMAPPLTIRFCPWSTNYYVIDGKSEKKYRAKCLEGHTDFVSSCNGLVLLTTLFYPYGRYFVLNPLLPGRITTIDTDGYGKFCGFFFHPLAKEFRVLFLLGGTTLRNYHMYLFGDKKWRRTAHPSFRGEPYRNEANPAIVNGALHWCGTIEHRQGAYQYWYGILIFDMVSEKFSARRYPKHFFQGRVMTAMKIDLLVKEDRLCLCSRGDEDMTMDIWTLEEYAKWNWIKKYKVNLDWNVKNCLLDWEPSPRLVQVLSIHNDELRLFWRFRGLFCCKLGSNIVKKIHPKAWGFDPYFSDYISCTKSLVILPDPD